MLAGLRVIEICDESGAFAGRILAELGADVVKLEPPGGDHVARRAPFEGGDEDPERSLAWSACNAGKRGITLDCERPEGRSVLGRLLDRADVLLDTLAPATGARWGLDTGALERRHPRLVRCAITPFGQTGPYATHHAGAGVLGALAGFDAEATASGCASAAIAALVAQEAVLGVMIALIGQAASGRGQLVDVSMQECLRSARAHGADARITARPDPDAARARNAAPRIGEHGRDVLREAGLDEPEIARLVADGVI